ncbi:MAG: precorrin-6Y methyltransferase [Curvibacter sp. RIFCSPHIGHO2_12_FULL_63_18]|uniref:precorrin-6y C5,15-methyltransferase (decarboxylating) subunit CbiE n=1 Tax=Rhodoferax sp. TaxID=50421 RepID=UPI0008C0D489|nr:precorrin-6y C5,15-methyltransferase (decarboxylating) subunit CbiE [Rhodoferax sp.]OGO96793.1 MAG: precorrin-6Y methyltransferase [Curvibacter sp. GWA2_63_95]OGP00972.1 MAG: precorrin-6Y methyltransferase [Curvibacter sp. RIFCSPHIGHO2_12_FULL_63_18]HCX80546.1 cobalamin biosynthesis bifunctional protein CbiET [Rhodoferax sp.]
MAEPWLSIIGMGEDGLHGLSDGSRLALANARHVVGGPRHLALAQAGARGIAWPVPFDIAPVLALRGQPTVVLASGDPFWFGAGGSLAKHLGPGEWQAFPAPSSFAWAAARLGWALETTHCFGLHATPFATTRQTLHTGQRLLCLLRDGAAVAGYAQWLTAQGAGDSRVWVLEALGGPRERVREARARSCDFADVVAPVAIAVEVAGLSGMARTPGRPDADFAHDGQITKSPVRAITLAALAPRQGEHLWDLGAGSGSIAVEWCLAGGTASAVEQHAERVAHVQANAQHFGVAAALAVVHGAAMQALQNLPRPDAVFVGGGFDLPLFDVLRAAAPQGCRLVVNAVTLETESALLQLHALHGGALLRIELAHAAPLGRMRGWQPSRPVVQWSIRL